MGTEELVDRLRDASQEVFADEPVVFAYLFGSQATGRTSPMSDIDIALYVDDDVDEERRFQLRLRVPDRLARGAGIAQLEQGSVQVVILNDAKLRLQGHVLREGVLVFSRDEPRRVAFEVRTRSQYFDFERFARPIDVAHLRAMAGD